MKKQNTKRDKKNLALLVILVAMAILFFSVTIIKFTL